MNENFTILIDTREQTPFNFGVDVATQEGTLASGDYSLAGLTDLVAIERKSLPDLCACIGRERDRFKRELHRLQAYRCRAVIVEAELGAVMAGNYRSKVTPASVLGSVSKWMVRYQIPFIFAGAHGAAVCHSILKNFHGHLVETVEAVTGAALTGNKAGKREHEK
ncbi:MAG: hypothetical protein K9N51_06435 [Candidatus Pacebacteria bacterium]|nr:hypothetical protein [Candidatus Paceibacterota bacterium]